MPRSGSSMVAGLFVQHGVWAGHADVREQQWNPKGSFENQALKRYLIDKHGRQPGLDPAPKMPGPMRADRIESVIRGDGYVSGPWLFKCSCLYYRVFEELDPIYIAIRRPIVSVTRSFLRTRWMPPVEVRTAVQIQEGVLDQLERRGALRVDSERLVNRDYSQISHVFRACGIDFDPKIADSWVDPELWHF